MTAMRPHDYYSAYGFPYKESDSYGFLEMPVLEFLNGMRWGKVPYAYIRALRPSYLRVTQEETTTDGMNWRVTVRLGQNGIIEKITQSVEVDGCCGAELRQALEGLCGEHP